MLHPGRRHRGLTLLELIIALAIVGFATTIGIPALRSQVLNAARTTAINGFIASAQLARSTAIRRNLPVVICPGKPGHGCENREHWSAGWIVFVNADGDDPPQLDDDETVLHHFIPHASLRIGANRDAFRFRRIGLRATNGTVAFCDERGGRHARSIIVSYTGRARVAATRADGSPIAC